MNESSDRDDACRAKAIFTIAAFPAEADGYTRCYYEALRGKGVRVVDGQFGGRWLLGNLREVDYVHLHWPSFFYKDQSCIRTILKFIRFLFLLGLCKWQGKRLLWTAHNLYPHDANSIPLLDRLARKLVTRQSFRVFAHGRHAAAIVKAEFPVTAQKLAVIPHGHWIDRYGREMTRAAARQGLGISDSVYVYLFLGQCKPYKNLVHLVATFQNLGIAGETQLLIVGKFSEESYRNAVDRQVRRAPKGIRVENRFVPDDELQMYHLASDIVVLPYTDVLTSGSAMLAMSFGRPVIAPRIGHLVDAVPPRCGVLYDPIALHDLSRAMTTAAQLPFDPTSILAHAREFDWVSAAETTIDALLGRRPQC